MGLTEKVAEVSDEVDRESKLAMRLTEKVAEVSDEVDEESKLHF